MAGEAWRVLGAVKETAIWITGSAFGGSSGSILIEESFSAASSSNSLSEYLTPFNGTGFESASVIKASPGQLYEILLSNPSAIPVFLQFFDRTSTPANGAFPSGSFRVEPSGSLSIDFRSGKAFKTGIVVGMSTMYQAFSGTASGSFDVFYK